MLYILKNIKDTNYYLTYFLIVSTLTNPKEKQNFNYFLLKFNYKQFDSEVHYLQLELHG